MILYSSTFDLRDIYALLGVQICVDAGGGRPRGGKFPRSMSDFKPGGSIRKSGGLPMVFRHGAQRHALAIGFMPLREGLSIMMENTCNAT